MAENLHHKEVLVTKKPHNIKMNERQGSVAKPLAIIHEALGSSPEGSSRGSVDGTCF